MKKAFINIFLAVFVSTAAMGCGADTKKDTSGSAEQDIVQKFDEYNLDVYMKPIWDGDVIYNETVMFVDKDSLAPLLYPAVEIISVRSYDLKTEYVRGVDYEYVEKFNGIILTKNKSVFCT